MKTQGAFRYSVGSCIQGYVQCGTTPTPIKVGAEPLHGRNTISVGLPAESAAATVWIGGENVSIKCGYPVDADNIFTLPVNYEGGTGNFYMIADTPCEVLVMEWRE